MKDKENDKMKKRIWSILLTLCMVFGMMPGTVFAVTGDAAEINGVHYTTLQTAVNAVTDGQSIKLLKSVTESISIPYGNTISFTLDLNGKLLTGVSESTIKHEGHQIGTGTGNVTLTITDNSVDGNGKITNAPTKNTIRLC